MSFTQNELRSALGSFATGVTVVTTVDQCRQPVGLTVNSFASVSLDPPLVLWSLRRESSAFDPFRGATHFAVNILSEDQDELCRLFASPSADKFAGIDIWHDASGVPLLPGVSASLECRIEALHPGGDHLIFIGQVEAVALRPNIRPLIHCRGAFVQAVRPELLSP